MWLFPCQAENTGDPLTLRVCTGVAEPTPQLSAASGNVQRHSSGHTKGMCFQQLLGEAWGAATQPATHRQPPRWSTLLAAPRLRSLMPASDRWAKSCLQGGVSMVANQSLTPRSALRAMKQPSMSAVLRKDQTILKHLVFWDSLSDRVAALFPSGNSVFRWFLESTLSRSLPALLTACLLSLSCCLYFPLKHLSPERPASSHLTWRSPGKSVPTPADSVNIRGRKTCSNIKQCFPRTCAFFYLWESSPAGIDSSAKNAQKKGGE